MLRGLKQHDHGQHPWLSLIRPFTKSFDATLKGMDSILKQLKEVSSH
jgi:hypothetical protein